LKSVRADLIFGNYFYWIAFSFIDFFFAVAFAPLNFTIFLAIISLLFILGYSSVYYEELSGPDDKGNELSDTGSSVGPWKLKDHPLIIFVWVCASNNDSRRIGAFFLVNLMFMFVEVIYGYLTNSLGLISDAAHMAFDCTALLIGLIASYISKLNTDQTYGYGL